MPELEFQNKMVKEINPSDSHPGNTNVDDQITHTIIQSLYDPVNLKN